MTLRVTVEADLVVIERDYGSSNWVALLQMSPDKAEKLGSDLVRGAFDACRASETARKQRIQALQQEITAKQLELNTLKATHAKNPANQALLGPSHRPQNGWETA